MQRHLLPLAVFLSGLAAIAWIAAGYLGTNPLALLFTGLVAAGYLAGARELQRYRQATGTLAQALDDAPGDAQALATWLERLHPSLRSAVRLRIEGERVALPGPALTPYLVGLLVLLGMLGTLLGMMATLRGTGLALESATDLQAMRASLAAPVKGLGFAFGTSIAGVAGSAMLGLLSALLRRERVQVAQQLDSRIATSLRAHSQAHQREESFRLLQRQAELMPVLVDRLQSMMGALEQQALANDARLAERQQAMLERTEAAYARLAESVAQSLREGAADSARAATAALQPAMEATLGAIARDASVLHAGVASAVEQQLQALGAGFEATRGGMDAGWRQLLEGQREANGALARELQQAMSGLVEGFDARAQALVDGIATRMTRGSDEMAGAWQQALARQQADGEALAARHEQALLAAAGSFDRQAGELVARVAQTQSELREALAEHDRARLSAWTEALAATSAALREDWQQAGNDAALRQQVICDTLADTGNALREDWRRSGEEAAQRQQALCERLAETGQALQQDWRRAGEEAAQRQQAVVDALAGAGAALRAEWQAAGTGILEGQQAICAQLDATGERLQAQWQAAADAALARQEAICDTLARTADEIGAQSRTHAGETIAEISRLVQTASEAPRAAAEVVAELREKLSDSMVRDTAMLEERNRLMATLETLLSSLTHASTEQRSAIDALVSTSASLLEGLGERFDARIASEADKLDAAAAQVTAGAVEIASLGDAFGGVVAQFGDASAALAERLQQVEDALGRSLARSDEQLAYYVAQAREVIDLSLLTQKQVIEDLQRLAAQRAAPANDAETDAATQAEAGVETA